MKILTSILILTMTSNIYANVVSCPSSEISFINGEQWELNLEKQSCPNDQCSSQFYRYNSLNKKLDGYNNDNDESQFEVFNLFTSSTQTSYNGNESIIECSGTYSSSENSAVNLFHRLRNQFSHNEKFKAILHVNQRCEVLDNQSFQCSEW